MKRISPDSERGPRVVPWLKPEAYILLPHERIALAWSKLKQSKAYKEWQRMREEAREADRLAEESAKWV